MLHRENHSASLCGLNQKPLPPHPSPSAGTMCGDPPECDCTCLRVCCVVLCGSGRKKEGGEVMKSPESLKAFPPVSWNSQRSWITIAAVFSPITFFLFFPLQPSTGYLIPNCLCCWSAGKINDKQLGIDNNQRLAASLWRHVLQSRLCQ